MNSPDVFSTTLMMDDDFDWLKLETVSGKFWSEWLRGPSYNEPVTNWALLCCYVMKASLEGNRRFANPWKRSLRQWGSALKERGIAGHKWGSYVAVLYIQKPFKRDDSVLKTVLNVVLLTCQWQTRSITAEFSVSCLDFCCFWDDTSVYPDCQQRHRHTHTHTIIISFISFSTVIWPAFIEKREIFHNHKT